jgi:hypothetical protein
MQVRLSLIFGALAASTLAFGQLGPAFTPTDSYQIGYMANLNIGDSVLNLSNSGYQGPFIAYPGFTAPATVGNICVNVYVMDPREEEIACCSCLVTPNGLMSLSGKTDMIGNLLTSNIPTSITVKLLASQPGVPLPGTNATGPYTVCNATSAAGVIAATANQLYSTPTASLTGSLAGGMVAWGTTLEPNAAAGSYSVISVDYKKEMLSPSELSSLTSVCNFIQGDASGFGICPSCTLGALAGAKQ